MQLIRQATLGLLITVHSLLSFCVNASSESAQPHSQLEAQALKSLVPFAKRNQKTLSLSLKSNEVIQLETIDTCKGSEDCEIFRLVGLSPDRQFFVVSVAYWEGTNVYWISRSTGTRYEVFDIPQISPDRKHIVTAIPSEAYNVNGVFLWEIRNGELIKKFHFEPTEYALYSYVRWTTNNSLKLKKFTYADKAVCPGKQNMEVRVVLALVGKQWKLNERIGRTTAACQ